VRNVASKNKQNQTRVKFMAYWMNHPNYSAAVHTMLGVGLGMLAQTYVEVGYVNSVGWLLVFLGVVGHLYPFLA